MPESEKTTLTRREREREQHKQEILDAAEEVFSVNGINGATIEDVARKADFAVGSIYNFFNGKEDLIRQVFIRLIESRTQEIRKRIAALSDKPAEALLALTQLWVSYHSKHGPFLRMMFASYVTSGKMNSMTEEDKTLCTLFHQFETIMSDFFRDGIKAGDFKDLPPEHLALVFDGICRSFAMFWERTNDRRSQNIRIEELFKTITAAINK